ncbi:MAG: hypothetical protein WCK58_02985 [Chloroflexota bacterium]
MHLPSGASEEVRLARNLRLSQAEALAIGLMAPAATFLAVLVVRLGGTPLEVALITAVPSLTSLVLGIPIGIVLARTTRVVTVYSRSRLAAHLAYGMVAMTLVAWPAPLTLAGVLVIWGLVTIPSTTAQIAFPIVMSGAAGPAGRYRLMSSRWGIMRVTGVASTALAGLVLGAMAFPGGYQVLFGTFALAGVASFSFARQLWVPPAGASPADDPLWSPRAVLQAIRRERAFVQFSGRQMVLLLGTRMAVPLLPLYYVTVLDAQDASIGLITAAGAAATLAGYLVWPRRARNVSPAILLPLPMALVAVQGIAVSFADSVGIVVAIAAVTGFCSAAVDLGLFDGLMRSLPPSRQLAFTGVNVAVVSGATLAASMLSAAIAQTVGIEGAMRIGSILAGCGVALFLVESRRQRAAARTASNDA